MRAADDLHGPAREHPPDPAGQRAPASSFWRRGSGHSTASATNETTSTIAAAQPNSHSGMGRSDRTEIPCADQEHGSLTWVRL